MFFTLLPKQGLIVHDGTWETLGMCATGSFDIEAKDLFIPGDQLTPLAPRQKTATAYATQQLYRLSIWPLVSALAAPSLGVARAAIDDLIALATIKVPFYTQRTLRDRDVVQSQIARAEAILGAARAYFYEALRDAWDAVEQPGSSLSQANKHKIQLATCNAIEHAAEVTQIVLRARRLVGLPPRQGPALRPRAALRKAPARRHDHDAARVRLEEPLRIRRSGHARSRVGLAILRVLNLMNS